MASMNKCDCCGKETYINPPTVPLYEEHRITTQVPFTEMVDDENNPGKKKKIISYSTNEQITRLPKMTIFKRQNPLSGDVESVEIQDQKDLKPRAYIIRLSVGYETLQKDFCKDCIEKVKPLMEALWDKMAEFKSQ